MMSIQIRLLYPDQTARLSGNWCNAFQRFHPASMGKQEVLHPFIWVTVEWMSSVMSYAMLSGVMTNHQQ